MSNSVQDMLKLAIKEGFNEGFSVGIEQAANVMDVYTAPFPVLLDGCTPEVKKELESQLTLITTLKESILSLKEKVKV